MMYKLRRSDVVIGDALEFSQFACPVSLLSSDGFNSYMSGNGDEIHGLSG